MEYVNHYNNNLNKLNKSLRENLMNSPKDFYIPSFSERMTLQWDIFSANKLLKSFKLLYNLPWIIKFLDSHNNIENNYPHTHNDTIFLNDKFFSFNKKDRLSLLIHEKLHIYQRYHPISYNIILFDILNLKPLQLISTHEDYNRVRMNPDNNNILYGDEGEYTLPILDDNAKTIRDVKFKKYNVHNKNTIYANISSNEHPNETTAYYLTECIMNYNVPVKIVNLL